MRNAEWRMRNQKSILPRISSRVGSLSYSEFRIPHCCCSLTTRTPVRYAFYKLYQEAGRSAAKGLQDFQLRGERLKYEKQIPSSATHRMVVLNGPDPVIRFF